MTDHWAKVVTSVCVCVCVRERERERACVRVCVCVFVCVCKSSYCALGRRTEHHLRHIQVLVKCLFLLILMIISDN